MTGYDSSKLSGMVEKVSSGATSALGNIQMTGFSSDNLSSMVSKVTSGATSGLGNIQMTGFSSDNISSLTTNITSSTTSALSNISMAGFNPDNISSEITNSVSSGASIGMTNLQSKSSAPLITSVVSSTSNGNYNAGKNIVISLNFNKAVNVDNSSGSPTITLETGAIDRLAIYSSVDNSTLNPNIS